ncbi:MAG: asparagine--tRNA ligase [Flavobacteriales bacterium]|nr:asparagine--tRNA ligase [Flavobacteriales bacterium]MCX7650465.1 asparagine--tRNA ligase [Flavobacteriales bacterium]MDW8432519.1 asparagine--tRNA ligase [Flavobacteriales bacterium]
MAAFKPLIREILASGTPGETVEVQGWVRSRRDSKTVTFLMLNDGSNQVGLQVVADTTRFPEELIKAITTGAAVWAQGRLVESPGSGQKLEVQADALQLVGAADPQSYPLQKKGHSLDFLRTIPHLRLRTNTFGAVFRVRHHLSQAIHRFFDERGFVWLHTPIIAGSDAEGAGAMFRVTTLPVLPEQKPLEELLAEDFFGTEARLTVSGQLQAEAGALALSRVYTFGPTFRAENSNTTRHLAEFWMVEPEAAFFDLQDNIRLAEEFLKYLMRYVLERCPEDLAFLARHYQADLITRLQACLEASFARITYTDAIRLLESSGEAFEFKPQWGMDLQSEHEKYLAEKYFKGPVVVTDYPKDIKAFYMRQNGDGLTVAAMDILFPGIGEVIGGSQREERLEYLQQRMREMHIRSEELEWYLDLRRFGSVPHSGFGMGVERFLAYLTGMSNVRDVILSARTPKNIAF